MSLKKTNIVFYVVINKWDGTYDGSGWYPEHNGDNSNGPIVWVSYYCCSPNMHRREPSDV